ncbi:hypothetical protein AALO_G00106490, partial [Alosa alosa]
MDPADSDFSMERLEEVEYTLSRLNSELVKSTDLERRLAISLMERTISSRSWLLKVPGMATLADQLSGLGKSLQSLLGPSSNPVFEATSLPPDPAPPAHCQGLRVGVLGLQPAASGPEPQPEEFQFPPELALIQVPQAPSRRRRGAKRRPTRSSDTMPPVPSPEPPAPVPSPATPAPVPSLQSSVQPSRPTPRLQPSRPSRPRLCPSHVFIKAQFLFRTSENQKDVVNEPFKHKNVSSKRIGVKYVSILPWAHKYICVVGCKWRSH